MNPEIEAIELHHYQLLLDPPFQAAWDPQPRTRHATTIVRVIAGGLEGVGSGGDLLGFAGHEGLFIGQDPFAIERHVRLLDNLGFHYGRMWPLEVALWDLMGKIAGQPLWKMLGGRSDRVRVYASTGSRQPVKVRVGSALLLKRQGFPALKLRFQSADAREDLAAARAVREAIGPDMALMIDANQGWRMAWDATPAWDLKKALWIADALAELDVFWLEEPLHRHSYEELAILRRKSRIRIAGGEGNREFADFRQYLAHGSLDVYQPDVVWSTGISRARQLAAEVQAAGAMYTPHSWGDGLVLLANLHVAAAVSQAPFVEYPYDPPGWTQARRDFILPGPILPDQSGTIQLPDRPGLGLEIDWPAIEKFRVANIPNKKP